MLKAVRFDLDEHKQLIEFVENYRDKKNRPNHSEAIRLLMQKGFESLNKKEEPKQDINIEALKNDIITQLMSQIDITPKQQPDTHDRTDVFTIVNQEPPQPKPTQKTTTSVPVNPLLANILGNSQR